MHLGLYSVIIKIFVSFPQDKVDAGLPTAIVSINLTGMKREGKSLKERTITCNPSENRSVCVSGVHHNIRLQCESPQSRV